MRDGLDLPEFGYLPFDHFVMAEWDPNSALSKQEQKRSLVEKWIRLGKYGRKDYYMDPPDEFPPHFPQDLLSDDELAVDGQISCMIWIWIRTWFGDQEDNESQDAANAAYKRLFARVMYQSGQEGYNDCMDPEFIFDNKEQFSRGNDNDTDISNGIALGTPGSVPWYLVTALEHCPDQFDGLSARDWPREPLSEAEIKETESKTDKIQSLLVLVADRKACEEGWVLYLAVNHKGQVLPFRIHERAGEVFQLVANWMDGQQLAENTYDPDEDVEMYMREGSGWN